MFNKFIAIASLLVGLNAWADISNGQQRISSPDGSLVADVYACGSGKNCLAVDNSNAASPVVAPMINRADVASAARTTSGNTAWLDTAGMGVLNAIVEVTAASGTTPKLNVSIQTSDDAVNSSESATVRQFTAVGTDAISRLAMGARYYRYVWTISGTTPSFTFSITSTLKNYMPKRSARVAKYADLDLSTKDATSSVFRANECQNVSIITQRAADGGNGSAWRVQVSNEGTVWDDFTGNVSQNANTTVMTSISATAFQFFRLRTESNTNVGIRTINIFWSCN